MKKKIKPDFKAGNNEVKVISVFDLIDVLKKFKTGDRMYLFLHADLNEKKACDYIAIQLIEWEEVGVFMFGGVGYEVHTVHAETMNNDWECFRDLVYNILDYLGMVDNIVGIVLNDTNYTNFVTGLFFD